MTDPTGRKSRLPAILISIAVVVALGAVAAIAFAVFAPMGTPADPDPGPSARSTANPDARDVCDSSSLAVNLGAATPGAGSTSLPVLFSNVSGETCVLEGYPTVTFVSADGTAIGAPSVVNESVPAASVDIAPGASATSSVVILTAPVDGCDEVQADRIQITLPESEEYFVIDTAGQAVCENPDVELLSVTAISAG